jgi:hypothetical protein
VTSDVLRDLKAHANATKAAFFPKFFKAGKGEYAEGDVFLGISVPDVRIFAKKYIDLSLSDIEALLAHKYHEARLLALIILTMQYAKGDKATKQQIADFYLTQFSHINNWDLVDCSAAQILGDHLLSRPRTMLVRFAKTDHLWTQRIAIVSTFAFIRANQFDDTLRIAAIFLTHKHVLHGNLHPEGTIIFFNCQWKPARTGSLDDLKLHAMVGTHSPIPKERRGSCDCTWTDKKNTFTLPMNPSTTPKASSAWKAGGSPPSSAMGSMNTSSPCSSSASTTRA